MFHMLLLHETGRTSKIYCHGDYDKVSFFPFYWLKDGYDFMFWLFFFVFLLFFPYSLGDPEMYVEANYLMSPVHIVPEWYFLFAYAILRAIPNKVIGVLALVFRIAGFYFYAFLYNYSRPLDLINKFLVFLLFFVWAVLGWLGQCYVEMPFIFLAGLFSFLYFFLIILLGAVFWLSGFVFSCAVSIRKIRGV